MERFYNVDLEGNISNKFEMRVEQGDDVGSLTLKIREQRRKGDSFADYFRTKGGEKIKFERESGEGVDLEGEDFSFVTER